MFTDPSGHSIVGAILGIVALAGLAMTIGGVIADNNTVTAIGLTMVAAPALISGGMAFSLLTPVGIGIGATTLVAGISTGLFASAEYQQAITGNNWMLDAGIREEWYNGLMITSATIATFGTIASATTYSLQMDKILKVGKINGVKAQPGHFGVRFTNKTGKIRSLELHSPHNSHGVHLQLNNWWLNHPQYKGQYYRAFAKHFQFSKFWKGWF